MSKINFVLAIVTLIVLLPFNIFIYKFKLHFCNRYLWMFPVSIFGKEWFTAININRYG